MEDLVRENPEEGLKILQKNFGSLSARITMLNIAVKNKLTESHIKNHPPSIFIAYKWEDEAHNQWVKQLANHLKSKGYDVLLDRDHLAEDASSYEEIPQYIAQMVGSDLFLVILTEKYLDFIEARSGKTTWVFDEYQQAVLLHNHGKLNMQAVWKSGDNIPHLFAHRTDTIDMRDGSYDFTKLDNYFPNYDGPSFTTEEKKQFRTFINQFDTLLNDPTSNPQLLADLLNIHSSFASWYEYRYRLMLFFWHTDQIQEAYNIAYNIREEATNEDHIILLAQIFDHVKDLPTLFKFLHNSRINFLSDKSLAYHYLCATTLYENNSVFAAKNHFGYLKRLLTDRTDISEKIFLEVKDRYNELDSLLAAYTPEHSFCCTECASKYMIIGNFERICGDCASEYESTLTQCPVCNNDGIISLKLILEMKDSPIKFLCPICHKGELIPD